MSILLLNIAINFAFALLGTLVIGGAAIWIAGSFTTDESARVASFAAACAYFVGKNSSSQSIRLDSAIPASTAVGSIAGLVVLWLILFRGQIRETEE